MQHRNGCFYRSDGQIYRDTSPEVWTQDTRLGLESDLSYESDDWIEQNQKRLAKTWLLSDTEVFWRRYDYDVDTDYMNDECLYPSSLAQSLKLIL